MHRMLKMIGLWLCTQLMTRNMTDNRKNLKVSDGTFEMLSKDKPDGVTWDYYLQLLIEGYRDH